VNDNAVGCILVLVLFGLVSMGINLVVLGYWWGAQ
jgi:hypothetical protein